MLNRWDPVFFLDSHTHNGSYHQEPVTWTWGLNPNGDTAVIDYMANTLWPAVERTMRETYGTPVIPHGDFLDPKAPEKGWVPLEPQPRYLSNYVGLRNRLSVLNEQYPGVDFETRVRGCYSLLFPAGTVYVTLAQRLAALAASLLEPESDDGLLVWNFLDRALSLHWGTGPREYPVYRVHDAAPLIREAVR